MFFPSRITLLKITFSLTVLASLAFKASPPRGAGEGGGTPAAAGARLAKESPPCTLELAHAAAAAAVAAAVAEGADMAARFAAEGAGKSTVAQTLSSRALQRAGGPDGAKSMHEEEEQCADWLAVVTETPQA